ncbi:MAG: hypothetical protein WAW73_22690 [Rhodoferax sp.]
MRQVEINFEAGLTEQFPQFRDVVKAAVYGCGRAFKVVAADLDMTSSELSRKLGDNPNDPVHFPLHLLPELIKATGDKRPVYWLVEAFLEDEDTRRSRAVAQLGDMLPQLMALLKSAGQPSALKAVG